MEILTLLKANMKKKKGTLISIAILMTIITTVMASIINVRSNYQNGFKKQIKETNTCDIIAMIDNEDLEGDLKSKLESSNLVKKAEYSLMLQVPFGVTHNGNYGYTTYVGTLTDEIRLFTKDGKNLESTIPEPKDGEVYISYGEKTTLKCEIGDSVTLHFDDPQKDDDKNNDGSDSGEKKKVDRDEIGEKFTVAGFIQDLNVGSQEIGFTRYFVNQNEYDRLSKMCEKLAEDKGFGYEFTFAMIYKSDDCDLNSAKFQRQLNLETKFSDMAEITLNIDQSSRYSTLLQDIIINLVMIFSIFLFFIVLIVMSHSLGTEIEMDSTEIGILKAQGFGSSKIRTIFFLQYFIAQVFGCIVGIFLSLPLERGISFALMSFSGYLPDNNFSFHKSGLYILALLVVSAVIIIIKTQRLVKISPVKAISGGKEAVYFDSRLNAPISKKFLTASIAFRQFTSAKRRYIGTVFIAAILTFFMISVNLITGVFTSKETMKSMGFMLSDIEVVYDLDDSETGKDVDKDARNEKIQKLLDEAEAIIEKHSAIDEVQTYRSEYCSINGEQFACEMYKNPQYVGGILKGRAPKYDNEIVVTSMVCDSIDIKMGDTVSVSYRDKSADYIITGIYQSMVDSGSCFFMNFEGAHRLDIDTNTIYRHYNIKDRSKREIIKEEIEKAYPDDLKVYAIDYDENMVLGEYMGIVNMLKLVIYTFSLIFSFVVVRMVCIRTFTQERRDIGIFKAMGFTSNKLRLSFAVRFSIVGLIGVLIGTILSLLFSSKLFGIIFQLLGIVKFGVLFDVKSTLIPAVFLTVCFFIFSYFASRKIKKVEVKELVTE